MAFSEEQLKDLVEKYKEKLKGKVEIEESPLTSRQYAQFKVEMIGRKKNLYEKLCDLAERIMKVEPDKKTAQELQEAIEACHLQITPAGAYSLSLLLPLFFIVFFSLFGFLLFNSLVIVLFSFILGFVLFSVLQKLPLMIADAWRLKASSQMVLAIFYVVTFMRHTSNLELAINFAAQHLSPPLSTDLKKVLWNVETGKFPSVKESLDHYLETWKKWSEEFVESFHLIESSLFESSEERRINALEKALSLMLDETYERMLHYAHGLKSPMTMLHMLGIILPILGLVILPLVVNFIGGVQWYHISFFYNLLLPIGVYLMGRHLLATRPTGYGDVDISQYHHEYKEYSNLIIKIGSKEIKIKPLVVALIVFGISFTIGIMPPLLHLIAPDFTRNVDSTLASLTDGKFLFFDYREYEGKIIGPYGLGAAIFSLFLTGGIGVSVGLYYYLTSKNLIKIRENAKKLEKEFASALFQLGNRIGDGLPVEIACQKVAEVMQGTLSGKFFEIVSINITRFGMGLQDAIFDKNKGALVFFPSNMIESSMKVLVESAKKGPLVVSNALMNVSRYIKEMHRVNERLKDLLADTISSMKTQISFITPAIAGIVVGLTSMITTILGQLSASIKESGTLEGAGTNYGALKNLFGMGIPPYYFQIVIGLYVVEVLYILAVLASGIENGADPLGEKYFVGRSLIRSTLLYTAIAFIVTLAFNLLASAIMGVSLSNSLPQANI